MENIHLVKAGNQMKYPERVMKLSKHAAMISLVRLIQRYKETLPEIYESTQTIWKEATKKSAKLSTAGNPHYFVPICDVEKPLRKNHHAVAFNTTALYGNTEAKRVYSWREGSIGPLNQFSNIAGARLRFLAMTRYLFPKAQKIKVEHIKRNGRKVSKQEWAYGGTRRHPTVPMTHSTLHAMDFIDAIRGYIDELYTQCCIQSVLPHEFSKYVDLLIFRLRPLLDKFYATGFDKKKRAVGFVKKAEAELDCIIEMVKGRHGTRLWYPQRITKGLGLDDDISLSLTDFISKVGDKDIKDALKHLKNTKKLIDNEDAKRLCKKIVEEAAKVGTRMHERISWEFDKPPSARSVILAGDYVAKDKTGYFLTTETPVYSRRGMADYTLFIRKQIAEDVERQPSTSALWSPRLVLDLKTKTSVDFGAIAKLSDKPKIKIADFPIQCRRLTDDEWSEAIRNTPSSSEKKQVDAYAEGLLEEYKSLAREDPEPPSSILKGIILTDGTEFPSKVRRFLSHFIKVIYNQISADLKDIRFKKPGKKIVYPRMLFLPELRWKVKTRLAIVTFPFDIAADDSIETLLPTPTPQAELHHWNPFQNRIVDSGHFILYLTADSIQSPGDSAGWVARHWHGLQFAFETAHDQGCEKVLWLDLAGEFANKSIRPSILRLDYHSREIREFHDRITFIDLSHRIAGMLFNGKPRPSISATKRRLEKYDLVIVSGIEAIRSIAPSELECVIDTFMIHIAEATAKSETCTIWLGTPSPIATSSKLYKRNQLRPFRFDSPLQSYIDEIVMNIPYPPRKGGSKVPEFDYARGLVRIDPDTKKGLNLRTIGIPPLIGWSRQFLSREPLVMEQKMKTKLKKRPPCTSRWLQSLNTPPFDETMLVSLFPFAKLWVQESESSEKDDRNLEKLRVTKTELTTSTRTSSYKGVLSRITFSKDLCKYKKKSKKKKSKKRYFKVSEVNTKRKFKTVKNELEPLDAIPRPPHDSELAFTGFFDIDATRLELNRLDAAITYLLENVDQHHPFRRYSSKFRKVIREARKLPSIAALKLVSNYMSNSHYTKEIWRRTKWLRDWLDGWSIPSNMRTELARWQDRDDDFLLYYGNYFVLMLATLASQRELTYNDITSLWDIVRPWVAMQLGAKNRTDMKPRSQYDTTSVFEQLREKYHYIKEASLPDVVSLTNIRYGLQIDFEKLNPGPYRWYIFEDSPFSDRFVTGCIKLEEEMHRGPNPKLRANAVAPLDEVGDLANIDPRKSSIQPVMIATHHGIDILYKAQRFLHKMPDFQSFSNPLEYIWSAAGLVRFGTKHRGARTRLRYIKVITLGMTFPSILQELPRRLSSLGNKMVDYITSLRDLKTDIIRVQCHISGTSTIGKITFVRSDEGIQRSVGDPIAYQELDQAVRILQTPHTVGVPFQGTLTWDPLSDVDYSYSPDLSDLENAVATRIKIDREEGTR